MSKAQKKHFSEARRLSALAFFALAAQASLGDARMGLMDLEARGSQGPQAVLDVRRGNLTTKQRRKTQTLILAAPAKENKNGRI